MTPLLGLAARSAWNRRFVLALVAASIALSTFLLLGIERIRQDVRASFSQAVSGTDLIVGARTGSVQLLLYSVFRIGQATQSMRYASAQALAGHRAVAWMVPLSLGDSHRGFPVLGTSAAYFAHFRHGNRQTLSLSQGRAFGTPGLFEVVLGAEVARRLGYALGQPVVISHGDGALAANDHADKPFTVVGVLAPTGTPVDRTVHISLESMEAIHLDWVAGAPLPGLKVPADQVAQHNLAPRQITAVMLGLKSRAAVFSVQRDIQSWRDEPLMAILPGVALDELWDVVGLGERALLAISALVAVVSAAGLVAVVLAGLDARRRELAILRAVGASPRHMLALLALEGGWATLAGVGAGAVLHTVALALLAPWAQQHFGLVLNAGAALATQSGLIGALVAGGWLASLVPGWRAYRLSLADGLSPRT